MRIKIALVVTALFCVPAFAKDFTVTIPEDKARMWVVTPAWVEKCQSDVAFRGDMNACLQLRNFLNELAIKMQNELNADEAVKK